MATNTGKTQRPPRCSVHSFVPASRLVSWRPTPVKPSGHIAAPFPPLFWRAVLCRGDPLPHEAADKDGQGWMFLLSSL
ncbi:unnamed protein product [Cuscuta campestris]|uniref:Uncharacterized protein n=1 Tax=Cuscuta campestris TaxID=132261 RepID=A0A484L936_9ASTE|nr:unnamed protein product [Cuscuta campestris]